MRIALVGFMGTGKSSVGRLLARRLGFKFLDTDLLIEKKEGRSIPEIFAEEGEEYFRRVESEVLEEIINSGDSFVLATGGGIVISAKNRRLLKDRTFPVLLTASPETIYRRTSGGGRPLLNLTKPEKRINELLKKREVYYREFKDRVDTEGKTLFEVTGEILAMIGADKDA